MVDRRETRRDIKKRQTFVGDKKKIQEDIDSYDRLCSEEIWHIEEDEGIFPVSLVDLEE